MGHHEHSDGQDRADNFNSTPGVTTYAYPTSITDTANNSSTVKYRYDIGAKVEANSPAPAGQTYGKKSKRIFDSVGRLERNSVYVNTTAHSYVRNEYPSNGVQSKTYAPIVDVSGNGNFAEDEVFTESWHDGRDGCVNPTPNIPEAPVAGHLLLWNTTS